MHKFVSYPTLTFNLHLDTDLHHLAFLLIHHIVM